MKKISIFYDSTVPMMNSIAKSIATKLNVSSKNIYGMDDFIPQMVDKYDMLLFGISDCENLSHKQWNKILNELKKKDLSGKTIALFGCDGMSTEKSSSYDPMKLLKTELKNTGAKFTEGLSVRKYNAEKSAGDQTFVGVAIDEADGDNMAEKQIEQWVKILNNNPNS